MTRLLKIAFRDYIAYVRTPGFWLSILLMPVGIIIFGWAPLLVTQSEPVPSLAVVDFTGQGYAAQIGKFLKPASSTQKPIARLVDAPGGPFADPAAADELGIDLNGSPFLHDSHANLRYCQTRQLVFERPDLCLGPFLLAQIEDERDALVPARLEQCGSNQHGHAAAIFPDEL